MSHTVLIVDDMLTCREPIAAVLRRAGYRVVSAEDGRRALDLVEDHWPDVILLDLAIPRMSGLDVLSELREMPQGRDVPVIVFSGSGDVRSLVAGLGVEECLDKPHSSAAAIHAAVDRAIAKREAVGSHLAPR